MKATVQLFHDNQEDEDVYGSMNEQLVPQLPTLLTSYRTDSVVVHPLIELLEYLRFPTLDSIENLIELLMDLFESESDWQSANRILSIVTHLNTPGTTVNEMVSQKLHQTTSHVMQLWKECYDKNKGIIGFEGETLSEEEMVEWRVMVVLMRRMNCLFSFCDIRQELSEFGIPKTVDLLLHDIPRDLKRREFVELRFCCLKMKQMQCLYDLLQLKHPDTHDSDVNEDRVVVVSF